MLHIRSYGISISTLEEVFLKVGHLDDPSTSMKAYTEFNDGSGRDLENSRESKKRMFNMKDNVNELDNSFINNL